MRTSLAQVGAGVSAPIPLDWRVKPFAVTLDVIVSGTVASTIEFTNDDVQAAGYTPAGGNWTPVSAGMTGLTAAQQAALGPNPVIAVRINQASGTGTTTLRVIQAGIR